MKKLKKSLAISFFGVVVLAIILNACSVSKRVYRHGYHVEWFSHATSENKQNKAVSNGQSKIEQFSSGERSVLFPEKSKTENSLRALPVVLDELNMFPQKHYNEDCDVIIFIGGEELSVKVTEVLQNSVKYKHCDNLNGPTYETKKTDIFMIKYANGTREIMEKKPAAGNGPIINSAPTNSAPKDTTKGNGEGDRSFVVAVLLWFFLGIIGVHRFYLGQYGMGILYLLTLGLCGIGWLIDGIMFLTGNLEPEDGEYYDN